jgi:hypothetical protein
MQPLVTEAMKKAAIAWLGVDGQPPYAVWCLWVADALYVVSGPGEQPAPGLADASTVEVSARGDHGGRIVTFRAAVTRVPGDDPALPQLAAKRLNSASAEALVARWGTDNVVSRLEPLEVLDLPDASLAAPPPPTPAARTTRMPWRLHRVRGAR